MKRIAALFLVLFLTGCAGWTFNGVDLSTVDTPEKFLRASAGAITSAAVHFLGHVACFEITGTKWRMDGFQELPRESMSQEEKEWCGRSGFIAQLAVGVAAKHAFGSSGSFWEGYHTWSAIEIVSYPLVHGSSGDNKPLISGGTWGYEYASYSLISLHTLLVDVVKDNPPAIERSRVEVNVIEKPAPQSE